MTTHTTCALPAADSWTCLFHGPEGRRQLERLQRIGRRITGCDCLANDAIQEAMIRLWELGDSPPDDFAAWLVHAVVHRSLHARRTLERRRKHEAHAAERREDRVEDPVEAVSVRELHDHLDALLRTLPAQYAEVLLQRYATGDDYAAVAAKLDLPIGTVRSRLSRARLMLRERLGRLGYDLDCTLCTHD